MLRKQDESFEQYKSRRTATNKALKQELKGEVFWASRQLGTYWTDEGKERYFKRKLAYKMDGNAA